jgi:cytidylate kinase
MRITLGGLSGSGTSTVASLLCKEVGLGLISAGDMFRREAKARGISISEFGVLAEKDAAIDCAIDERQKDEAMRKENVLVEGRLSGFIINVNADLRVWLKAPLEVRLERVAAREKISVDVAMEEIKRREESELSRYKRYYGMDIEDLSAYDLVIDSSRWESSSVVKIIMTAISL